MNGLFAPHARAGDRRETIQVQSGRTVVYDPEYPDWHLSR